MQHNGSATVPATDADLVREVRAGTRSALGLLYLRHGEAAWRVACISTGFSADAEVALIEGFTEVFVVLPGEPDTRSFRSSLLGCVRQVALHRAGRRTDDPPVGPDEVDLRTTGSRPVEVLSALPELDRCALWLMEVEAMTPGEASPVLGVAPEVVCRRAEQARVHLGQPRQATLRPVLLAALPPLPLLGGECQRHYAAPPVAALSPR